MCETVTVDTCLILLSMFKADKILLRKFQLYMKALYFPQATSYLVAS